MYTVTYQRPNAPPKPSRAIVPAAPGASAQERERAYQASFAPEREWERTWKVREDHTDRDAAITACRNAYYAGAIGTQVFGPTGVEFSIYRARTGGAIEQERVEHAPEQYCNECGAHVPIGFAAPCPTCRTSGMYQIYTSRMIDREIV